MVQWAGNHNSTVGGRAGNPGGSGVSSNAGPGYPGGNGTGGLLAIYANSILGVSQYLSKGSNGGGGQHGAGGGSGGGSINVFLGTTENEIESSYFNCSGGSGGVGYNHTAGNRWYRLFYCRCNL